jgi:hypothetical protein
MAEEQRRAQQSSHSPSASDLTGTTLGKYRLIEKLGQGGWRKCTKRTNPISTGTSR